MKPYPQHGSNPARFYLQKLALSSARRGFFALPAMGPAHILILASSLPTNSISKIYQKALELAWSRQGIKTVVVP